MKKYATHITILIAILFATQLLATPKVRMEDKIRIREAIEIRNSIGESIWKGISEVPFAIILVTETYEYLFNHPYPSNDFTLLEHDPITGSDILYRETTFPLNFEATFPAVNGLNCVVIGIPENTQSASTSRWILTLLHENFHQFQAKTPQHYDAVNGLNLSNGDETGMWQLNFPFPYDDPKANKNYQAYRQALLTCYQNLDQAQGNTHYDQYIREKKRFMNYISKNDRKYWSFQLWKEGIARYTELQYLNALVNYSPSNELKKLKDYVPFNELRVTFLTNQLQRVIDWELSDQKRTVVYSLGMVEGVVLDHFNSNWKETYTQNGMNLSYFE
ncbi:MAG: hypothetical protein Aureis2KO_21250 [Aureisphaera sp.]